MREEYYDEDGFEEPKSRTALKKEMNELQEIGNRLAEVSAKRRAALDLPEELELALAKLKTIKKHEALRRHKQYIGKLMRFIDIEPVRELLDAMQHEKEHGTKKFHALEQLRDSLIAGDNTILAAFLDKHPDADRQRVGQLIRNARNEAKKNKPPKSSRALFKYLRELTD